MDATGVLEWNTDTNTLVAFHANVSGGIEMSPSNDHAFVIDATDGVVNVLTPAGEVLQPLQKFTIWLPSPFCVGGSHPIMQSF